MTYKAPFFITASLLVAGLAPALPDLGLDIPAEELVKGAAMATPAAVQQTAWPARPTHRPLGRRSHDRTTGHPGGARERTDASRIRS